MPYKLGKLKWTIPEIKQNKAKLSTRLLVTVALNFHRSLESLGGN